MRRKLLWHSKGHFKIGNLCMGKCHIVMVHSNKFDDGFQILRK